MKNNAFLKLIINPAFLDADKVDLSYNNLGITHICDSFLKLKKDLEIVKEQKDFIKAKNPQGYLNLQVEFNESDETEISRGKSYKISSKMKTGNRNTIQGLKDTLSSMGMNDTDFQDFTLQLLLQNRIAIQFILLGGFQGLVKALIPEAIIFLRDELDSEALRITYNSLYNQAKFTCQKSVIFYPQVQSNVVIGKVKASFSVSNNFDVKMNSFFFLFNPRDEVAKQLSDAQTLAYENVLRKLFSKLKEASTIISEKNLRPPPCQEDNEQQSQEKSTLSPRTKFFPLIKSNSKSAFTLFNNEKHLDFSTIYGKEPSSILGLDPENSFLIEEFTFLPEGLKHEQRSMGDEEVRKNLKTADLNVNLRL
jgi:hypothetical protein